MTVRSRSLHLFCRVVDNYGDIGICWRLARQLQREHGVAVTLWVDDLPSFQRICPEVVTDVAMQDIFGVKIQHWRDQNGEFTCADVADIVIEFFACDIPPAYIAAMAQCTPQPVWLNLEGLTAETWVEGCHRLSSPHPQMALTKHFFFPGFTDKTGGLLIEAGLMQQRQEFLSNQAQRAAFLRQLGLTETEMSALKISLFCYPHAPVQALFDVWQNAAVPVTCLVPEGVATEAVQSFIAGEAHAGATATHGALTVRVLPFVPQPDYDKLLWACDLNFVRGEDSFVRAQWAGKPFIWHIYPQDENLHHKKLKAFLQCYGANTEQLNALSLAWNDAAAVTWATTWALFQADMPRIALMSADWQRSLLKNGDLASNLLKFADALAEAATK